MISSMIKGFSREFGSIIKEFSLWKAGSLNSISWNVETHDSESEEVRLAGRCATSANAMSSFTGSERICVGGAEDLQ